MEWDNARAPSLADFERIADEAFARLPEGFRARCEGLLIRVEGLLVVQAAAFWPVWRWCARRFADAREDWGSALAPVLLAVVFLFLRGRRRAVAEGELRVPVVLTLLYALACPFVPGLARAFLAVAALTSTLGLLFLGRSLHGGLFGLAALALRVVPTLQLYLGYPLRVVVAAACVGLLRLGGVDALRQGVGVAWPGGSVIVDAPCSGVRMLWAALLLVAALACFRRLSLRGTALAALAVLPVVVAGNVLRSLALTVIEMGGGSAPSWVHPLVGVAAFLVVVLPLMALTSRLAGGDPCD